jgi:hypothetical protein
MDCSYQQENKPDQKSEKAAGMIIPCGLASSS